MDKGQPIPPGAIKPEIPLVDESMLMDKYEENAMREEEDNLAVNLGLQDDNYIRQPAPGDKGKIIQFINTVEVEKEKLGVDRHGNPKIKVTGGDVPKELYKKLYGYLAHNASMSNFSEQRLEREEILLDKAKLLIRMSMSREDYTPAFACQLHNALHLAKCKLYQNIDGDERYYCAVDLLEEKRKISLDKGQSPTKTLMERLRLKGGPT